tara:strand:- start:5 stop:346 length:342 start_codon:yes stop_codon:yes gene_type:complete
VDNFLDVHNIKNFRPIMSDLFLTTADHIHRRYFPGSLAAPYLDHIRSWRCASVVLKALLYVCGKAELHPVEIPSLWDKVDNVEKTLVGFFGYLLVVLFIAVQFSPHLRPRIAG